MYTKLHKVTSIKPKPFPWHSTYSMIVSNLHSDLIQGGHHGDLSSLYQPPNEVGLGFREQDLDFSSGRDPSVQKSVLGFL